MTAIEYKKTIEKEFNWSVRTSRLIGATLAEHAGDRERAERIRKSATKAEAMAWIEQAKAHCAALIRHDLEGQAIDGRTAEQGRQAIDKAAAKAKQQAEQLED